MKLRITFDYDPYADYSHLEQWDTPEKYAGNEVHVDGQPVPFEEYITYWGNPARYVSIMAEAHSQCDCCGSWVVQASLGDIHFMDDDCDWVTGTFTEQQAASLKGYCKEVAEELFAATRERKRARKQK